MGGSDDTDVESATIALKHRRQIAPPDSRAEVPVDSAIDRPHSAASSPLRSLYLDPSRVADPHLDEGVRANRIIVVPTPYGPPWREGVANLARRLVEEVSRAEHRVTLLTPGASRTVTVGEFGEQFV